MPSSESSFGCLDTPDASTLQQSHKHMAFCGVLHSQSLQTNESRLTSPAPSADLRVLLIVVHSWAHLMHICANVQIKVVRILEIFNYRLL